LLLALEQALQAFDYKAVLSLLQQSVNGFAHDGHLVDYLQGSGACESM
jgi:hypothetical protein